MLNKFLATLCAWALAPVSMLFVLYLPVSLYGYANGDRLQLDDFTILLFIFLVSYTVTAVVGLLAHVALLYWHKDKVTNYTLMGGAAILLWCALVLVTDGIPRNGFRQSDIVWFLVLMAHGLVISTSFAISYKKVYELLTQPKQNLDVLT